MNDNLVGRPLTIKDVAQLAGVSPATVSNVLNGKGRVSRETMDRVSKIVKQYHFNVNASARTLRQRNSRIIGILVPLSPDRAFGFNPYYWHFADGVMQVTELHGYDVILKPVTNVEDLTVVWERDLDGVIVVGAYDGQLFTEHIRASGIPLVFVDSYISGDDASVISLDDRFGAYLATRHLIGLGHQRILFVSGARVPNGVDHERYQGYQQALQDQGQLDPIVPIEVDVALESGRILAHQLAYKMNGVTAIVATADTLAMGLIRGFKDFGIMVPQNISIVGFDDIAQAEFLIPALTTVHQDVQEKGRKAAARVVELMEDPAANRGRHVRLTPKLVIRESTANPEEA